LEIQIQIYGEPVVRNKTNEKEVLNETRNEKPDDSGEVCNIEKCRPDSPEVVVHTSSSPYKKDRNQISFRLTNRRPGNRSL
jgi:hypothetical protein